MKFAAILFLVAATTTATAAAQSEPKHVQQLHLGKKSHVNENRKLEGEVPEPPDMGDSFDEVLPGDDDDGSSESVFTPAMDLEFFRTIDPELFEWVDPKEIQPGSTTCGFLNAPLGSLTNVTYPIVHVYVCVKFAKNQPAPKGNLAVHCGGPGSLSECVYNMGSKSSLGYDNADNYNVIAFDQVSFKCMQSIDLRRSIMPFVVRLLLNHSYYI